MSRDYFVFTIKNVISVFLLELNFREVYTFYVTNFSVSSFHSKTASLFGRRGFFLWRACKLQFSAKQDQPFGKCAYFRRADLPSGCPKV